MSGTRRNSDSEIKRTYAELIKEFSEDSATASLADIQALNRKMQKRIDGHKASPDTLFLISLKDVMQNLMSAKDVLEKAKRSSDINDYDLHTKAVAVYLQTVESELRKVRVSDRSSEENQYLVRAISNIHDQIERDKDLFRPSKHVNIERSTKAFVDYREANKTNDDKHRSSSPPSPQSVPQRRPTGMFGDRSSALFGGKSIDGRSSSKSTTQPPHFISITVPVGITRAPETKEQKDHAIAFLQNASHLLERYKKQFGERGENSNFYRVFAAISSHAKGELIALEKGTKFHEDAVRSMKEVLVRQLDEVRDSTRDPLHKTLEQAQEKLQKCLDEFTPSSSHRPPSPNAR